MTHSCLYAVGSPEGPFKIGYTANIKQRLATLRGQTKRDLSSIAVELVSGNILEAERYAHWLLREKHLNGEWFTVTGDEATAALREACREVAAGKVAPEMRFIMRRAPPAKRRPTRTIVVSFPIEMLAEMEAARQEGEDRTKLIRRAVANELQARAKAPKPKPE